LCGLLTTKNDTFQNKIGLNIGINKLNVSFQLISVNFKLLSKNTNCIV